MHRIGDHLGRFLPKFNEEDPFPKGEEKRQEEEELFENVFVEVPNQENSPTTSEESFHLNNLFAKPEYQDNPLALIIYQPPQGHSQMAISQPTFPFPIPPQQGNQNLKNIPSAVLPKFYGLITEDPETFLFEFDILF